MFLEALQGAPIAVFLEALAAQLRPNVYLDWGGNSGVHLAKMAPRCLVGGEISPRRFEATPSSRNVLFHLPNLAQEPLDGSVLRRVAPEGIELAFLGGGKLLDEVLRQFVQVEKASRPGALIVIGDCLPRSVRMAERVRRPGGPDEPETARGLWTGDVWKILPILRQYRPDLDVVVVDCPPCGLALCRPLNPKSVSLIGSLQSIIDDFKNRQLDILQFDREITRISSSLLVSSPDEIARRLKCMPEVMGTLRPDSLFRRQPVTDRFVLFPALTTDPPLPLFREAELEPEIRREHYERQPPHDVAVRLVTGFSVYGGGILSDGSKKFFEPDIFPPYFRPVLSGPEDEIPPVWAGSITNPQRIKKHLNSPCIMPVHPNLVYGHFLLEVLPKFWLAGVLRRLGDKTPVLLPSSIQPWVRSFADLLFDKDNIIYYDFRTEEVVAPAFILPSMMHLEHHFHPAFNLAIEELILRVRSGTETLPSRKRLYLSRSRLRSGWHHMTNEEEIERCFEEMGFEIIHPQELSVAEQIQTFSAAAVIAGEYSSALHNALFAPVGTKVIALNRINWYQSRIAALRGHHLGYIRPADGIWHDWRMRDTNPSFSVRPDEILRYVTEMLATPFPTNEPIC